MKFFFGGLCAAALITLAVWIGLEGLPMYLDFLVWAFEYNLYLGVFTILASFFSLCALFSLGEK